MRKIAAVVALIMLFPCSAFAEGPDTHPEKGEVVADEDRDYALLVALDRCVERTYNLHQQLYPDLEMWELQEVIRTCTAIVANQPQLLVEE